MSGPGAAVLSPVSRSLPSAIAQNATAIAQHQQVSSFEESTSMAYQSDDSQTPSYLLCRAADRFCALPIGQVGETMRPLPISPIAGLPDFVRGVSVIRGMPTPVLDLSKLVDGKDTQHHRLVTINIGSRNVALLVQAVIDVRAISSQAAASMPPLLRDAADKAISAVGILDQELLIFLTSLRSLADAAAIALSEAGAVP